MTWRDKLEIGLKKDAPYRKDNLPDNQVRGPQVPAGPDRSPIVPAASGDVNKTGCGTEADARKVPRPEPDEFSDTSDDETTSRR
jgi:hypothetical protein